MSPPWTRLLWIQGHRISDDWLLYLFLAVLGLLLVVMGGGYSLVALCRHLIAVTSLVVERVFQVHGLQ